MLNVKIVNITHGDDADGLTCAALLQRLFKANTILANYDDLEAALASIGNDVEKLYITDLNLREALLPQIQKIRERSSITLIDHHSMQSTVKNKLQELGVEVIHDTRDCASILVYSTYLDDLKQDAAQIAVWAAIADMFEDGPIASILLDHMDRKWAQHEALILNHALGYNQSEQFKCYIIESLAKSLYPHQIKGASEAAFLQLERLVQIKKLVPDKATRAGRFAYMECGDDLSTGEVANIIMDALGVDIGVCYKYDGDWVNISFRGERKLPEHLGDIAAKLSEKYGGFGGGHNRAAGAKIHKNRFSEFKSDFSNQINQ